MTNIETSKKIINQLVKYGVRDFVVCPGGRCAPLLSVIEKNKDINTHHFFDERSASFFALGVGKKNNRPAVVVTTSGTAVSECLSAFIEAYYSATPIIIMSADRPKSYRDSGAPQAISQSHIFSDFATHSYDLEDESQLGSLNGQVHINICFDEPLLDDAALPASDKKTSNFMAGSLFKKPLVIVGALSHDERSTVAQFLKGTNYPCYLESASNLKGEAGINHMAVHSSQLSINYVKSQFDSIIRVGSVPTVRLWRDLEKSDLPVKSFSKSHFSGLSRDKDNAEPLSALKDLEAVNNLVLKDSKKLSYNYESYSASEPSFVNQLSKVIPKDAVLFLGNSMVIRHWDDYGLCHHQQKIYVNRGANGIDGLISTALGCAEEGKELWVVVGDQSALYDLQSLWACQSIDNVKFRIVVINNGGGKIFSKVFKSKGLLKMLENNHQLSFKPWAELFGLDYCLVKKANDLKAYNEKALVIECVVDNNETYRFTESLYV